MARHVQSTHQFTHDPQFRLSKEMLVVRCDDKTIYEWEKPKDEPNWRMTHAIQPDGSMTHTGARKILPDAVEETVGTLLEGWSK